MGSKMKCLTDDVMMKNSWHQWNNDSIFSFGYFITLVTFSYQMKGMLTPKSALPE